MTSPFGDNQYAIREGGGDDCPREEEGPDRAAKEGEKSHISWVKIIRVENKHIQWARNVWPGMYDVQGSLRYFLAICTLSLFSPFSPQ